MILNFVLFYLSIMCAMCLDNIFWIPTSPEYKDIKKNFTLLFGLLAIPKNKEGLNYCWKNRILEVIKHPRDIIPAIISSIILSIIF